MKSSSKRKIELVPLIDVIFLLLIFFLVTLNIIPVISQDHMPESQFNMPVVTADDAARVDMLIQLHQFPNDPSEQVYYYTIDHTLDQFSRGMWNVIVKFSQDIADRDHLNQRFPGHHFRDLSNIDLNGVDKVIISADQWVPYEKLFEVIQLCVVNNVRYYATVSSFEKLRSRVYYTEPQNIIHHKKW